MIHAVYSADYQASGLTHFSRLDWLYRRALTLDWVELHCPAPLPLRQLRGLHSDDYLLAMECGQGSLARSSHLPWSPGLVESARSMLGGQLLAVDLALEHGLAFNLACGFHHAHPDRGGGFCVFNGLALSAAQHPELDVLVLDCDEHGGDGTEVFSERLANLTAISIFGTRFGVRGGLRSIAMPVPPAEDDGRRDAGYLQTLDQALDLILNREPDIVLYQASADSHLDDPKSLLKLSTQTLATRDHRVFAALSSAGIPVVVTLGGGYQSPEVVGGLYLQSLETANKLSTHRPPGRINRDRQR